MSHANEKSCSNSPSQKLQGAATATQDAETIRLAAPLLNWRSAWHGANNLSLNLTHACVSGIQACMCLMHAVCASSRAHGQASAAWHHGLHSLQQESHPHGSPSMYLLPSVAMRGVLLHATLHELSREQVSKSMRNKSCTLQHLLASNKCGTSPRVD